MKTQLTFLLIGIFLTLTACGGDSFDYKFADKEDTIACNNAPVNTKLFKESLYSFEEELKANYARETAQVAQGYNRYMSTAMSDRVPNLQSVSQHTRKVIAALKNEQDLWTITDGKYSLNYDHALVTCIGDNLLNQDLQTTFKALISTNSMSKRLISSALRSKVRDIEKDRFLATYVALDMYYARLMDVDFTKVLLPLEYPVKDIQKPQQPQTPPSASKSADRKGQ